MLKHSLVGEPIHRFLKCMCFDINYHKCCESWNYWQGKEG